MASASGTWPALFSCAAVSLSGSGRRFSFVASASRASCWCSEGAAWWRVSSRSCSAAFCFSICCSRCRICCSTSSSSNLFASSCSSRIFLARASRSRCSMCWSMAACVASRFLSMPARSGCTPGSVLAIGAGKLGSWEALSKCFVKRTCAWRYSSMSILFNSCMVTTSELGSCSRPSLENLKGIKAFLKVASRPFLYLLRAVRIHDEMASETGMVVSRVMAVPSQLLRWRTCGSSSSCGSYRSR
mmetsp:Transcript_12396/g.23497  ORF Transcript_12396/g.23497 Transcript_12396/m.23497 type:complete len:244 (+) Transcript_12396:1018-1749(+)